MNKPTKPNIVIPESFAENGIKTDFDNEKLTNGFDRLQPDVLAGDNLNKLIDDTYKASNYALNLGDYVLGKNQITNCILEVPSSDWLNWSGSTISIKEGIKYITSNGRNADYTLKNILNISTAKTLTVNAVNYNKIYVFIANGGLNYCPIENFYIFDNAINIEYPTADAGNNQVWISIWDNIIQYSPYQSTEWITITDFCYLGVAFLSNNTIKDFRRALPVDLLKRSDKKEMVSWANPTGNNIVFNISGTSGKIIPPEDGWLTFNGTNTANTAGFVYLGSQGIENQSEGGLTGLALYTFIKVSKGKSVTWSCNNVKNLVLRFAYSKGVLEA